MYNLTELHDATPQEICDYYDSHPNLTLVELARRSGRSVFELKRILKGES
jgi:AraC-like DNA-binding protein